MKTHPIPDTQLLEQYAFEYFLRNMFTAFYLDDNRDFFMGNKMYYHPVVDSALSCDGSVGIGWNYTEDCYALEEALQAAQALDLSNYRLSAKGFENIVAGEVTAENEAALWDHLVLEVHTRRPLNNGNYLVKLMMDGYRRCDYFLVELTENGDVVKAAGHKIKL